MLVPKKFFKCLPVLIAWAIVLQPLYLKDVRDVPAVITPARNQEQSPFLGL